MNKAESLMLVGALSLALILVFSFSVTSTDFCLTYILLFWIVTGLGIVFVPPKYNYAFLPRLMITLYAMPFSVTVEYLFNADPVYAERLSLVSRLTSDESIVSFIMCVALIGILGLLTGMLIAYVLSKKHLSAQPAPYLWDHTVPTGSLYHRLPLLLYCTLLLFFVVPYVMWMPEATLFSNSYADIRGSRSGQTYVPGFAYAVYLGLIFLALDARYFRSRSAPYLKTVLVGTATAIVCLAEMSRGSRTFTGLLVAFIGLALLFNPPTQGRFLLWHVVRRHFWLMLAGLVVATALFVLGVIRSNPLQENNAASEISDALGEFYKRGTWVGAFYSCFGLADEYVGRQSAYLHGKTYIDYFLSLPPSLVARAIGYQRPIDSFDTTTADRDVHPSWWYMGYTVGGLHPIVVPFRNFGPVGPLIILMIIGYIIAQIEIAVGRSKNLYLVLLYAGFLVSSLHWFWYGDMYIIRASMAAFLVAVTYNLVLFAIRRI